MSRPLRARGFCSKPFDGQQCNTCITDADCDSKLAGTCRAHVVCMELADGGSVECGDASYGHEHGCGLIEYERPGEVDKVFDRDPHPGQRRRAQSPLCSLP